MQDHQSSSYKEQILATYFALVEDVNGRPTTAEDLRVVLVDSTLGVTDSRNIFDDDNMVGMFTLTNRSTVRNLGSFEKKVIGVDHVIDNTALANLLALELLLSRQVTTVVISKMVIRSDGEWLNAGIDKKLGENGLKLSLT